MPSAYPSLEQALANLDSEDTEEKTTLRCQMMEPNGQIRDHQEKPSISFAVPTAATFAGRSAIKQGSLPALA